ncbi:MAG: hypothetical protein IKB65_00620 [Ruminiclostridium sp.]|nr:hypothetical protein [Ruminiclostridium sp.]
MINSDVLREFRPVVRYKDGSTITPEVVQAALQECADKMGIPVAFRNDQIKSGSFFKPTYEDCLVMYHPDHLNDYFNFCIRVSHQGSYAFVSVNDFGVSKQISKADHAEWAKQDRKGKPLSYKVGSKITSSLTTLGKNKQKLEEEQMYYQCIFDLFDEIIT